MRDQPISRAVVTGGAGFIGSHIVDALLERDIEVYVLDNFSTGSRKNLCGQADNEKLHVIAGDIGKIHDKIPESIPVDIVFHEAAIASVPQSVSDPLLVHEVNVNKSLSVMEFCVKRNVKRIIFASSAAVYGLEKEATATENLVCRPSSPYGASKLAIENYLNAYNKTYGLEAVVLRYFNVYGPRQSVSSDYSGVINIFITRLLQKLSPTIFGDGRQTRDFVFVKDVANANILAMEAKDVSCNTFNVATGRSINILELLDTLKKVMCAGDIPTTFGPARPGDGRFGAASIDKISESLHYTPRTKLEDGLAAVVNYIKGVGMPDTVANRKIVESATI